MVGFGSTTKWYDITGDYNQLEDLNNVIETIKQNFYFNPCIGQLSNIFKIPLRRNASLKVEICNVIFHKNHDRISLVVETLEPNGDDGLKFLLKDKYNSIKIESHVLFID